MELQHRIRANAAELSEYISDLNSWQDSLKSKRTGKNGCRDDKQAEPVELPAVRGSVTQTTSFTETTEDKENGSARRPAASSVRVPAAPAASSSQSPSALGEGSPRANRKAGKAKLGTFVVPSSQEQVFRPAPETLKGAKSASESLGVRPGNAGKKSIYAYDYRSWDKFDVDKYLEESETTEAPEKPAATEPRAKAFPVVAAPEKSVEQLKTEGNALLKAGKLDQAVARYSEAIGQDAGNAVLFANRSMAHLRRKAYIQAVDDATEAISLDPNYVKAHFRRAKANRALGNIDAAIADLEIVLQLQSDLQEPQAELKALHLLKPKRKISIVSKSSSGAKGEASSTVSKQESKCIDSGGATAPGVARGDVATEETAKDAAKETTAKDAAMEETTTEETTKNWTTTEETTKEETTKNTTMLGVVKEATVTDETTPDEPTPDETTKEATTPDAAMETNVTDETTKEETTKADVAKLESSTDEDDVSMEATRKLDSSELDESKDKPMEEAMEETALSKSTTGEKVEEVPTSPPSSFYEFERVWHELSQHPSAEQARLAYLELIPASRMPTLLQTSLSAGLLCSIIAALEQSDNSSLVHAYLAALGCVDRFAMTLMFLEASEKASIHRVVCRVRDAGLDQDNALSKLYEL